MHNDSLELPFGKVLVVLIGLAVAWWMARAPVSFLKLLSVRFLGLDKDRPWLNWIVCLVRTFHFLLPAIGLPDDLDA